MKYWIIVCFALINCGEQDINDSISTDTKIDCEVELPSDDDNDNNEEEAVYELKPHMYFSPQELMFYYGADSERLGLPQIIQVCNATDEVIEIFDAYVIETEDYWNEDDSSYFVLSYTELPQNVEIDKCLFMEIFFMYSPRLRSAQLKVHTSFEAYAEIIASLSGKIFFF